MHLQVFQSGKGDCLLLSNEQQTARILIDGGMPDAYREFVGPALGKLRTEGRKIDLVYVSHIDQDHIGGVLQMLDDEVAWRVHDYQRKNGNPTHKAPRVPRPPSIGALWHNAFHEQVTKNAGAIEDAIAATAPILTGADLEEVREVGLRQAELATSIREAIQVSRRIGPKQLGIGLNGPAGGKLMMLRKGAKPITLGGMKITVLGPVEKHLKELRKKWNDWLRDNAKALQAVRDAARRDEDRLGTSDFDRLLLALKRQAASFGDPDSVTTPNLASLTLLVEEGDKSVLLTGDARGDQIIDGLIAAGRLSPGETFAVDVLKVPHHGSENNIDQQFCDTVVAADYVFCGNGEHENPDLRVVDLIARRRMTFEGSFKFWFNSSEAVVTKSSAAAHMAEVEKLVRRLVKTSKGQMKCRFLEKSSSMSVS